MSWHSHPDGMSRLFSNFFLFRNLTLGITASCEQIVVTNELTFRNDTTQNQSIVAVADAFDRQNNRWDDPRDKGLTEKSRKCCLEKQFMVIG